MKRYGIRSVALLRKQVRCYFAFEPLDDDESENAALATSSPIPTASMVNGRYVSSICKGGSKKNMKDVLNWLWTSKQSRLALPSFKYHDKENIVEAPVDYKKIQDRGLNKLSWVSYEVVSI